MGLRSCLKPWMQTISAKTYLQEKHFLLLLLFVILTFPCLSQSSDLPSTALSPEKIYLQLDSKFYTTNEAVWFKAIVTDATDHVPTDLSAVLYVELIGTDERIVEKKVIKLENGIGDGFFQLRQNYAEGLYLVRAYTQWNRNFGNDFFYKEYIRVFTTDTKEKVNPITRVIIVEEQNNERRLEATLNHFAIDSLHKKDLTLVLLFDGKKDTITIRKNKDDKYLLNYAIPDSCQFVTLQMRTKENLSYFKTIALDKGFLDLQFFPESGELVQGVSSLVGFKALDCEGKGTKVEGEIVNEKEEVITHFKSNELGLGTFTLANVDCVANYSARLFPAGEGGLTKMYPLPKVASKGNVLSVKKDCDRIKLNAFSNYLKNDSLTILASCRGIAYYSIKGHQVNGSLAFSLPVSALPEGIIAFTLMDTKMQPVAERLYFNERPETRVNIAISSDKESYMQREPTNLTIDATDSDGKPVNASLSVLVLNKEQMGEMQDTRQNILSYFLVSSDLKGEIEKPGYYFTKNENRQNDLDALMLTQGWRKYNYTKPVSQIRFQPEPSLTVSGIVSGVTFSKKEKKDVKLTMMTFGNDYSVQEQTTDTLGRFCFDVNDEFGQNLNVVIQSANKTGKNKDYTITLDKKESPPILFNQVNSIEKPDSLVHAFVGKNIERKKVDDAFPLSKGDILLDEVTVQGYNMTPARKKVAEEYGKPDEVIEGKDIQAKEQKWSYGLYSVLMFNFPDKVKIISGWDGTLYAVANNPEITLVVIDGIPVAPENWSLIPNIPPSEVRSFEVIEYAKNFLTIFCELFPQVSPFDAPKSGNIIAIYTYAGKGLFYANRSIGILKAAVPVFSESREFYEPKYPTLRSEDWFKPDLRALIHWAPKLKVDSLGRASSVFYNADNTGKMKVVVEAISDRGEIGYKEIEYEVVKREF